ncbi:MAG: hypothetical protein IJX55_04940 [Clostridia bacterium]|nr:hypothetical protein [Clostridia bacterium]
MAKNNNHKKLFRMDEFGRKFYCQHARLNLVRDDKKQAKKKARQENKRLPSEEICDDFDEEIEKYS